MIITKNKPFSAEDIKSVSEQFEFYIKTVIDINLKICSAGCDRHFDSEQILLHQGSNQKDLWGGGIDLESKVIDFNSFINIRPSSNNTSNEIQDQEIRRIFESLSKYFFKELYEQ